MTVRPGFMIGSFVFERCIGEGAFASVWRAHQKLSDSPVAVKLIKKDTINTQVAQTRLQREISLLKKMSHPFIAQFFQLIEDGENYYLVMEFVENGNLLDYVNTNGRLSEDQARRYFAQLVSVLEYLHNDQKVAHRDLKCENVLLDRYNNIRLIDFGLSNMFTDINPNLSTACGSPAYAAPEMIKGNNYTQAADVWSAGILLFAVVAGHLPFDDDNVQRLLQKIVYTNVKYPSFLSPQLVDLLNKMICKSPEARITLEKVKEHPWFSQTEYQAMLNLDYLKLTNNNNTQDSSIDREIIERMSSLGYDCRQLHNSLLMDEVNDLTCLYRILERQKTTEKMKNLMQSIQQQSTIHLKTPMKLQTLPLMKPPTGAPGAPKQFRFPGAAMPQTPGAQKPIGLPLQTVLKSPVGTAGNTGRRFSRQLAVRKPMNMNSPNAVSLDM